MNKKDVWINQIDDLFSKDEPEDYEIFLNIISIALYGKENPTLGTLYKEVGLENLGKIVTRFSGKTITIPDKFEFRDLIIASTCYFLKEIKHMDWDQIKKELPYQDISSIKYGKQIVKLNNKISDELLDLFSLNDSEDQNSKDKE